MCFTLGEIRSAKISPVSLNQFRFGLMYLKSEKIIKKVIRLVHGSLDDAMMAGVTMVTEHSQEKSISVTSCERSVLNSRTSVTG